MPRFAPLRPTAEDLVVTALKAPPTWVTYYKQRAVSRLDCLIYPAQAPPRDVADVGRVSGPVRGDAEVRCDHAARVVLAQRRVDGLFRVQSAPSAEVHLEVLRAAIDHVGDVSLFLSVSRN